MLMKKILLTWIVVFLGLAVSAQSNETLIENKWNEVDSLLKIQLTKSALTKIDEIQALVDKKANAVQEIRILTYRMLLEGRITEMNMNSRIKDLDSILNKCKDTVIRSFYHTLIAKQYLQYLNELGYKVYGNTQLKDKKTESIETWHINDFNEAITDHFLAALAPTQLLQNTFLEPYDILIKKGNARFLRPTLYDLLTHEALQYFKTQVGRINQPIEPFTIKDPAAFAGYQTFTKANFQTTDSSSHLWICLQLYQRLEQFHLKGQDKSALIEVDVDRIEWVYSLGNKAKKDKSYREALQAISNDFATNSYTSKAWYSLANQLVVEAKSYHPKNDSTQRWKYVEAKIIIDKVDLQFGSDYPYKYRMNELLIYIKEVTINSITEKVTVPQKPFRVLLNYRNIDTVFMKLVKLDEEIELKFQLENNNRIPPRNNLKIVNSTKAYRVFEQILPATNDYQPHNIELKIDGLPIGSYALLCSSNKDFLEVQYPISFQKFQVTNISYVQNKHEFFVLDRSTGMPLEKAEVRILKQDPVPKKEWLPFATKLTDQHGYFNISNINKYAYYSVIIKHGKDLYYANHEYYFSEPKQQPDTDSSKFELEQKQTFFFTDRGIYRPGQNLFFKGIVFSKDFNSKKSKLIAKDTAMIYLKDANYTTIDSLKLESNDYGSFQGQFRIPENRLAGSFFLTTKDRGAVRFQVEQYKRPTFNVKFEKNKGTWQLNDSITVIGNVKAFAGNKLTNAKISYQIQRKIRSYYINYGNYRFIYSNRAEIAFGEIKSDSVGNFYIRFKASADEAQDSLSNLIYDFSITATVTDGSGETRIGRTQISCGSIDRTLEVSTNETSLSDSVQKISVQTKNLSNVAVHSIVKIKISALVSENRLFRKRYWEKPDVRLMDKQEFWKYFPSDEYENELDYTSWPKGKVVLDSSIDTRDSELLILKAGRLSPGYYCLESSTKDSKGKVILSTDFFKKISETDASYLTASIQLNHLENDVVEPTQSTHISMAIAVNKVFMISNIQRPNQSAIYQFETLAKGINKLNFTATESDRGNVYIDQVFVYDNRVYLRQHEINIPWTNKSLQLTYSSYRDQTEPGAPEKWTIQVSGEKGKQVTTEMLSSMYDASLDELNDFNWAFPNLWPHSDNQSNWDSYTSFSSAYGNQNSIERKTIRYAINYADALSFGIKNIYQVYRTNVGAAAMHDMDNSKAEKSMAYSSLSNSKENIQIRGKGQQSRESDDGIAEEVSRADETIESTSEVVIRKNFSETAFFFPQLYADSLGNYQFSFTMPDAVTKWKWQSYAHSKDLATGYQVAEIQTQKTLMLQTNAPRFMREGDKLEFNTRISNISKAELTGQITLQLIDPETGSSVDGWFQNVFPTQYFTVGAGQNSAVKFPIQIPFSYNKPLTWRVVAKSGNYSDGEENSLPILSNRQLVTESFPLYVKGDTTQHFRFEKLIKQNSSSASNESLTVEFTSNPTWYVIQALPYLQEGNNLCVEGVFHRFYANALSSLIVQKFPAIQKYYEQWKDDSTALLSNLQKNQSLKQLLLEETPWVMEAKTEAAQKKRLKDLFNVAKLATETEIQIQKLAELQLESGAFSWFKGGYDDPFMTNLVLTGIGKLKKLGAITPDIAIRLKPMILKALAYTDGITNNAYQGLLKSKIDLNKNHLGYWNIQYLSMRSYYLDIADGAPDAHQYFLKQGRKFWTFLSIEQQALLATVFERNKEFKLSYEKILPGIIENAVVDKQKGMYWKTNNNYFWRGTAMATQLAVTMMAAEMKQNRKDDVLSENIDAMKTWILLNKQTNRWNNSLLTADACYTLLMQGSNWQATNKTVNIQLGKTTLNSEETKTSEGTGYFQKRFESIQMNPEMGEITVTTTKKSTEAKSNQPAWGAVYWQYFEDLDKITPAATPLKISKQLMIETNDKSGKKLEAIDATHPLHVGDKLVVRLVISTDRDMEYVHLKDLRASGTEPLNVISGYNWKGSLGYYQSTTDAATNFYFGNMYKGTYVFEYPLFVTHLGDFSVGIASLQCLYAPEFSSHSEGIRIQVVE